MHPPRLEPGSLSHWGAVSLLLEIDGTLIYNCVVSSLTTCMRGVSATTTRRNLNKFDKPLESDSRVSNYLREGIGSQRFAADCSVPVIPSDRPPKAKGAKFLQDSVGTTNLQSSQFMPVRHKGLDMILSGTYDTCGVSTSPWAAPFGSQAVMELPLPAGARLSGGNTPTNAPPGRVCRKQNEQGCTEIVFEPISRRGTYMPIDFSQVFYTARL